MSTVAKINKITKMAIFTPTLYTTDSGGKMINIGEMAKYATKHIFSTFFHVSFPWVNSLIHPNKTKNKDARMKYNEISPIIILKLVDGTG